MIKSTPFSISPNPANLYLTPSLKSTIFKIRYTIEQRRGLACLLGDVGMGKSSVLRLIHSEYTDSESFSSSMIQTPNFTSEFGLLKGICADLGLPPRNSLYNQEKELREFLFKQFESDKNTIVFIDESQRLSDKMLELVRTMLNLETNTTKLIQIILCGQLELQERLTGKKNKAIRSRVFMAPMLDGLTLAETKAMIEFRCEREGLVSPVPNDLYQPIYDLGRGIPREILKICDIAYALMLEYEESTFNLELIETAGKQIL
ncbi:MAG: hypothetical protein FD167_5342 [bacterium]|nr:MAG: hypothetical protein FD167_5342 [bacterium]